MEMSERRATVPEVVGRVNVGVPATAGTISEAVPLVEPFNFIDEPAVISLPLILPVVCISCEPKSGDIFVPAMAAAAFTSASNISPLRIIPEVTLPVPIEVTPPAIVTSPVTAFDSHFPASAIRILFAVAVVVPRSTPLILSTEVVVCVPETSPTKLPEKFVVVPVVMSERRATVPDTVGRVNVGLPAIAGTVTVAVPLVEPVRFNAVPVAFPIFGVTSDGELSNTSFPVPVAPVVVTPSIVW